MQHKDLARKTRKWRLHFVTNERSHELNLEYRDTDRPTDVISLEYKPELDISFDEEELAENPELAEMMGEFDSYIGELFISVDKAHEQAEDYGHSFEREMGFLDCSRFSSHQWLRPLYSRRRSGNVWITGRNFDCLWTYATIIHKKSGKIENLQLVLSLL